MLGLGTLKWLKFSLIFRGSRHTRALNDISNGQIETTKKNQKKKTQKKKSAPAVKPQSVPNFDSFEDYSLVVQSVTPIKTHVSITDSSDHWAKFPVEELLDEIAHEKSALESLASSSPHPNVSTHLVPCYVNISRRAIAQSCASHNATSCSQKSLGASPSSRQRHDFNNLPVSMQTRRAKRLRQRLGESMSTSTPEQVRTKISRYNLPSDLCIRNPYASVRLYKKYCVKVLIRNYSVKIKCE